MNTQIITKQQNVFDNADTFETAQRMAKALSASSFVPKEYKNNMPNALIALEVANRTGASVFSIMQNLYIVHGRPSWSSQFIIAAINTCGRFKPLQFKISEDKEEKTIQYKITETTWIGKQKDIQSISKEATFRNISCIAFTHDKDGTYYESPEVSIEMAMRENWYDKKGSKWQTLPELMLRYRASSFFGKLYAPEILMGMSTVEESHDTEIIKDVTPTINDKLVQRFQQPKVEDKAKPQPVEQYDVHNLNGENPEELTLDLDQSPIAIKDIPDRTKDDLEAKAQRLIELIKDGGNKVDLMQAFGDLNFASQLTTAGLGEYHKTIMEL